MLSSEDNGAPLKVFRHNVRRAVKHAIPGIAFSWGLLLIVTLLHFFVGKGEPGGFLGGPGNRLLFLLGGVLVMTALLVHQGRQALISYVLYDDGIEVRVRNERAKFIPFEWIRQLTINRGSIFSDECLDIRTDKWWVRHRIVNCTMSEDGEPVTEIYEHYKNWKYANDAQPGTQSAVE